MVIGLEISTGVVRAARLGRPRAGASQSAERPIEGGRLPLAALVESLGARNAVWGVAVPSSWCFYRTISLPYNAPGRVAATFRYALEGRLPGSVEEYCVDALSDPRPAGDKGCRLAVAACPKEKLRDLLAQLKEAGISPCLLQPAIMALAQRLRGAGNALILRVGQEAEWAVLRQGEIIAAGVIPLPAEELSTPAGSNALAERLRFALSAAELASGEPALERCILVIPVAGTDAAVGARHALPLQREGEARLVASVTRILGIPVEPPPPELGDPAFAAAWGIAAQAADKPHLARSLLQGEFSHPAHASRYERRAAVALVMAIGIVLLLGVRTFRGILEARARDRDGQADEQKLFRAVFPNALGAPDLTAMKNALAALEKQSGATGDRASALVRWTELLDLLPPDVTLDSVEITPRLMTLRARAKDRTKAFDLQRALAKSPSLRPGSPAGSNTAADGVTTFTMEVRYK